MRHLLITTLFITIFLNASHGQDVIERKFFKDKYGFTVVGEKKAKFVETITKNSDGSTCDEMRDIKNNTIIFKRCYINDTPTGIWITFSGEELNYDFELAYSNEEYEGLLHFLINYRKTKEEINGMFDAPIPLCEGNDFKKYIASELTYPDIAAENGIQGKVTSQFIIDETGKLVEFSILKSAGKILDKESARVIQQLTNWTPAKINGSPIRICIIAQTVFVLQ